MVNPQRKNCSINFCKYRQDVGRNLYKSRSWNIGLDIVFKT